MRGWNDAHSATPAVRLVVVCTELPMTNGDRVDLNDKPSRLAKIPYDRRLDQRD